MSATERPTPPSSPGSAEASPSTAGGTTCGPLRTRWWTPTTGRPSCRWFADSAPGLNGDRCPGQGTYSAGRVRTGYGVRHSPGGSSEPPHHPAAPRGGGALGVPPWGHPRPDRQSIDQLPGPGARTGPRGRNVPGPGGPRHRIAPGPAAGVGSVRGEVHLQPPDRPPEPPGGRGPEHRGPAGSGDRRLLDLAPALSRILPVSGRDGGGRCRGGPPRRHPPRPHLPPPVAPSAPRRTLRPLRERSRD